MVGTDADLSQKGAALGTIAALSVGKKLILMKCRTIELIGVGSGIEVGMEGLKKRKSVSGQFELIPSQSKEHE